jgi:hypothetical protein
MSLSFPNPSRSYDSGAQRIRFLGHDGMFAVPFFVEIAALSKHRSTAGGSEATYLDAFDADRDTIQDIARKAYSGRRKSMYVLTPADFK